MRTYLPLTLLLFTLLACKKEPIGQPAPEQPVLKTVTFHVFAGRDYSDDRFSSVKANAVLQLGKIDRSTGAAALIWDTTFSTRPLSLFPQREQMFVVQKTIPVYESTHKLSGGYGIKYDTDGMLQQEGYGEDIPKGQTTLQVEVIL